MADKESNPALDTEALATDSASYELLRERLSRQATQLESKTRSLNSARIEAFGHSEMSLLARLKARTENNCVARDIVQIGDTLLFGYNVFIGLRQEIRVEDVFSLFRLEQSAAGPALDALPLDGSFLADTRFAADFRELYTYYKQSRLSQLRIAGELLLAAFQIGEKAHDLRVFRWRIGRDGQTEYIDNRGERDIALPPTHDFEWTTLTRAEHVGGKHPHVNVLDTVFIETVGGDLTVKIENNTETGLGIYSEPVEDRNQALTDAEFAYAQLGTLILLRVRPYREKAERYFVYNTLTQAVTRIDAIGRSCVQLSEDHGIIFPGGYYLQSGESKRFDLPGDLADSLRFKRMLRSPNGEDVLYVFYQPGEGHYALFSYNLIEKRLGTPIVSNGYARYEDGRILVMQAESEEPTRQHPMQLWQTPFFSEEHAASAPAADGFFGRVGNAELVRAISELHGIARMVAQQTPTRAAYDALIRQGTRCVDAYFWLDEEDTGGLALDLKQILDTARATLDEFEKVESIRRETEQALARAQQQQHELVSAIAAMLWKSPVDFIDALARIREQRGRLQRLRELRYMDMAQVDAMDAALSEEGERISARAVAFLADAHAFDTQRQLLERVDTALTGADTADAIDTLVRELDDAAAGLDLLTEHLAGLGAGDAVVRTEILDRISGVYADLNRIRAQARQRRGQLGASEAAAEFGAQFKLFGQAVENALELADSPEKCDDALTRLLAQLEEIEGRFAEHEQFLGDIAEKREAVYEAISARRQTLLEARQRRSQALADAGVRILEGVPRRVAQLQDLEAVHAYFAADPLLGKLRQQIDTMRALGAAVLADDLATRLDTARDQALRSVRDKKELIADDGNSLRFGKHAFTINRQPLDLTLVPRDDRMSFHLNGTDYFEPVADAALDALAPFQSLSLVSESPQVYRVEFLTGSLVRDCLTTTTPVSFDALLTHCMEGEAGEAALLRIVREYSAARYQEGYQKGVHDADTVKLLMALVPMQAEAGLLASPPEARALGLLYWLHGCFDEDRQTLLRATRSSSGVKGLFGASEALMQLETRLRERLTSFAPRFGFEGDDPALCLHAARYLSAQLSQPRGGEVWIVSARGADLAIALERYLEQHTRLQPWRTDLEAAPPEEAWQMALDWLHAYARDGEQGTTDNHAWVMDAATVLVTRVARERRNVALERQVDGLLGEHERIRDGAIALNLNDFWWRFDDHVTRVRPGFEQLQKLRMRLIEQERQRLRLAQFKAQPLSSFVRNQLIDKVYLPIIGDNLAKQIGTAGEGSRTDRMGMLLLISPPGYGKTTLMEYVADRLGLNFVRINCPALGHEVTSIDPASARHSGARQELEKLNLGLAMGNNVMLYLDDIQHTSPEFLQKFIALADGTRRIEAVRHGEPVTCDLRGKRFAIVMAGNPYTESGDVFKIPDMLANRADIYNLGDVLSGNEALFAQSYLENALTANPLLQPLAARDPKDVSLLLRMAAGEDIASTEFAHGYSRVELGELVAVVQRMMTARALLLKVNQAYIESAAQQDAYREEPPFKLQGSYRNMAKLAARITPLMSSDELDALLRDHYRGEAQTLTTGAEENLLKLAQMLGSASADEQARWRDICDEFVRRRKLGGDDADGSMRIANTVLDVARAVDGLRPGDEMAQVLRDGLARIDKALVSIEPRVQVQTERPDLSGIHAALQEMHQAYEKVLLPLVNATYLKMRLDHSLWDEVKHITAMVEAIETALPAVSRSPKPKRSRAKTVPSDGDA